MLVGLQLYAIKSLNSDDFLNGTWIYGIQKCKSNLRNDLTLNAARSTPYCLKYLEHFILKISVSTLRVLFLFGFSRYHHPWKTTASTFARSFELSREANARMDASNHANQTTEKEWSRGKEQNAKSIGTRRVEIIKSAFYYLTKYIWLSFRITAMKL